MAIEAGGPGSEETVGPGATGRPSLRLLVGAAPPRRERTRRCAGCGRTCGYDEWPCPRCAALAHARWPGTRPDPPPPA